MADSDATVVRRLKEAGAVIVGQTNVPFMLADNQTFNELYGVTNNPWDNARTPGGSTGGEAAALAAGMSFLGYGSDISASIRNPASFCGIYGLRPSFDVVLTTGFQLPVLPQGPLRTMHLPVLGPLARSAADLRTALRVTAGPEDESARAYTWALPAPRHSRLKDYRIGFVLDHQRAPVVSAITALLSDAIDALARAGVVVVEGWPEGVDPGHQHDSYQFYPFFSENPEAAPLEKFIEFDNRRLLARTAWSKYFKDFDVFVSPVNLSPRFSTTRARLSSAASPRPKGERPYLDQFFWMTPATLIGFPAVVAPIGRTPEGLPVGMQIVGPLFEDDTAITFAGLLADIIGGFERPPRI